jgi:hypothetical protein
MKQEKHVTKQEKQKNILRLICLFVVGVFVLSLLATLILQFAA